jgi:hypothetical protein
VQPKAISLKRTGTTVRNTLNIKILGKGGTKMGAAFKQEAIVTYVRSYNFPDEKTKREVSGVSIEYLITDNLNPVAEGEAKGVRISSDILPYEKRDNIGAVPGKYEISFTMQPSKSGKPQLRIADVKFISVLELVEAEGKF